jgi:transposase-like protein
MSKSDFKSSAWGDSLKYLPWDKRDDISHSQKLISTTVHEWYDAKHRQASLEEVVFVNSIEISQCRLCGSTNFISYGKYRNGIKRYYCNTCHHSFSALTGTIFEDRKIPISEWIEYLIHLFEFHSITTSARDNRNAYSTGRYWLFKVFAVLKHIQDDVLLEGTVYLDETFFSVIKSQKQRKEDGKEYRGISKNKLCVAVAYDDCGHVLLIYENTSKPSRKSTWKALGDHISPRSHLIHDGEKSHSILIEKLQLTSEVYNSKITKELKDKDNPLDPVNRIHFLAKRFMREHGGFSRDNLQEWMNLISFLLSEPRDRYMKIDHFINLALNSPCVVKYRDVMSRKTAEQAD